MPPRWSEEEFKKIVKESLSVREVLLKFNLHVSSGNYRTFYKYQQKWNIDTSHFLGLKVSSRSGLLVKAPKPLNEILTENNFYPRHALKKRIIKDNLLPYECDICNIKSWQGKKISLHIDHINGINNDNRLENLRFLCPNCHSQTETYSNKRFKNRNFCADCKTEITKHSTRCRQCEIKYKKHVPQKTKIDWPPTDQLIKMVDEDSYIAVGKKLGVSDNAIRKRIKNHS